jgi:hypothetical protein
MRERTGMHQIVLLVSAATLGALLAAAPGAAAPPSRDAGANATATDISAQSRTRRPRTRLRVTPLYPYRTYHSLYPLPYDYEYPGPNAKRQCVGRLVQEARPSGTVIVPRLHCWWVSG